MIIFVGVTNDLHEAVAYELQALNYLRGSLFNQSESSADYITVTLGDLSGEGRLKKNEFCNGQENISEDAVRSALSRLRPLTFSVCFKLHDMIVEWILRANGCNDWSFHKKLENYDQLIVNRSLVEPEFLTQRPVMSSAFWGLYRYFVPYRGTVIHSGGVVVTGDGTVEITTKSAKPLLRLTDAEQASYVRAMCLIADHHVGRAAINPHFEALIESDLSSLAGYHSVQGLRTRDVHLKRLVVNVPTECIQSLEPLTVSIDFNLLRDTVTWGYTVDQPRVFFFTVDVVLNRGTTISRWLLPIEAAR